MVVVAASVPLAGGDGESSAAVPACLALGDRLRRIGEPHALRVGGRHERRRLAWLSVGTTVAFIGLITTLFALPSLFPTAGRSQQTEDASAARYLIWHVALIAAAVLRAGRRGARRSAHLLIFGGLGALLLAWAAVAPSPLGDLASGDGFSPTMRALVALIVIAHAGVAALWWRRAGGAVSWADLCVLSLMILSALDAFAYMWASAAVRGRVVGEPRAARRPVRDPRRSAC